MQVGMEKIRTEKKSSKSPRGCLVQERLAQKVLHDGEVLHFQLNC